MSSKNAKATQVKKTKICEADGGGRDGWQKKKVKREICEGSCDGKWAQKRVTKGNDRRASPRTLEVIKENQYNAAPFTNNDRKDTNEKD